MMIKHIIQFILCGMLLEELHGQESGPADGDVRLVNGPSDLEGRIEIFHDDVWGTVCDDVFEDIDGQVVCTQLGHGFSSLQKYGAGTGQIWLDDVGCTGSEQTLGECSNTGWGVHNCGHNEDQGVRCILGPGECGDGSECDEGYVCESHRCSRDCNTFAIDEFLVQCSTEFDHSETMLNEQHKSIESITAQLTTTSNTVNAIETSITSINEDTNGLQQQIDHIVSRLDSYHPANALSPAAKAYFGIPINGGQTENTSSFKDQLIMFMVLMNILLVVCIGFLCYKLTRISGALNYQKVDVDAN
eukprot:4064_1